MIRRGLLTIVAALACAPAFSQVAVDNAWVRGTVPAQKATGAFMQLKSDRALSLVGARTPVAGAVEIHEMRMDRDMMRMRQVARLDLAPGKAVQLQPGGYHLMLLDLKKPLAAGDAVPLKLRFVDADNKPIEVEIKAAVRALHGM